jgi:3-hydroxybutyryl-CoA dehydrogenase
LHHERIAIAGAGTIACGLAATAAQHGEVVMWARSDESADRAGATVAKHASRIPELEGCEDRVSIVTDFDQLSDATFLVEAVVEHHDHKAMLLTELARVAGPEAVLASTTSSLSISTLAAATGRASRFVGLHVFNPVPRMELVELVFPAEADDDVRTRARDLCTALGKTPVEVPDTPGFVVNRLLFPYLFDAVELMGETGLDPADLDRCMTLGAGVPMGPIALLDFVGLDVAQAIGETIGARVPQSLTKLVEEGALGRKTKHGFYDYD